MAKEAITIVTPKNFGLRQILIVQAIGASSCLFLAIICYLVYTDRLFSINILLIIVAVIYFFPFFLGEPYIVWLVRRQLPPSSGTGRSFICQIAMHPRLHDGIRGWIDDADDVGYLNVSALELLFEGDHVSFCIPIKDIARIQSRNVGWRRVFLGRRIRVSSSLLGEYEYVEFLDRSAVRIADLLRNDKRMLNAIEESVKNSLTNIIEGD